jgi:hypothetical protein
MKQGPKPHEIEDITRSIRTVIDEIGFPPEAAVIEYAVVDGFYSGEKTRALVFAVRLRQSHYRKLNRPEREALDKRLRSCYSIGFGPLIFREGKTVIMKTRGTSDRRSLGISLVIDNDEAGRPTEVTPSEMFPDVRTHSTAPLDAMFGLYTRERTDRLSAGRAAPYSVSAIMSALVEDPIWNQGEVQLLPLPTSDNGELLEHVRRCASSVRLTDAIRARSWSGVLLLAYTAWPL